VALALALVRSFAVQGANLQAGGFSTARTTAKRAPDNHFVSQPDVTAQVFHTATFSVSAQNSQLGTSRDALSPPGTKSRRTGEAGDKDCRAVGTETPSHDSWVLNKVLIEQANKSSRE
jgi:hypothetical protein